MGTKGDEGGLHVGGRCRGAVASGGLSGECLGALKKKALAVKDSSRVGLSVDELIVDFGA